MDSNETSTNGTMMRTFKSKPLFAILEAVYFTNFPDKVELIDFYLIRGHWKLKDLQVVDKQLLYKGKEVDCPYIEVSEDWGGILTEEEIDELDINETVDELRFADDDWETMFYGSTTDDIIIEE